MAGLSYHDADTLKILRTRDSRIEFVFPLHSGSSVRLTILFLGHFLPFIPSEQRYDGRSSMIKIHTN